MSREIVSYVGIRTPSGRCEVWRDEGGRQRPLDPRLDLRAYSPTGFEWGYNGAGPSQLALALLADHLGDNEPASELCHTFREDVVSGLPHEGWTITADALALMLDALRPKLLR